MEFLKRIAKRIFTRRTAPFIAVAAVLFAVPAVAYGADIATTIGDILARVFEFFTRVLGFILLIFVRMLIEIAQYNDFVGPNAPSAVKAGWIVARDLANMFFIVVLIVISFGTILSIETYHYSKHLPKLLITAIAINFSKTICGIFIDMGQVVMLTFVNGFASAAGGNFIRAFQIEKLLSLRDNADASGLALAMGMFLAFVLVAISLGVVIAITVMLVWRVVTLWILIIVSPLAWMTRAMPFGKAAGYYSDWWGKFTTNVMAGPTLAFFLWLALLTVQTDNGNTARNSGLIKSSNQTAAAEATTLSTGIPTEAAQSDAILSLIIVSAILMIGLDLAGKSGAVGAGIAGTVKGRLQKYGNAAGAFAWRNTGGRAIGAAGTAARTAGGAGLRVGGAVVGGTLAQPGRLLQRLTGGRYGQRAENLGRLAGSALGVRGTRVKEEQKAARQKWVDSNFGTAVERAKTSPKSVTSMINASNDEDKQKIIEAVIGDKAALATMAKNKSASGEFLNASEALAAKKPSFLSTHRKALVANWKNGTEQQQAEAFKYFGEDDAAKLGKDFFEAKDSTPEAQAQLARNRELMSGGSDAAVQYWLTKGSDDQRKGFTNLLKQMEKEKDGEQAVKDLLTKKRVDATKLSPDLLNESQGVRSFATDRAIANKDDRKIMMADSKVAKQLKDEMLSRLGKAKPGEAGKVAVDAVSLKAMDNEELKKNTALLEKIAGSLDLKGLAQKVNSPTASADDKKAATTMMAAYAIKNPVNYEKVKGQPNYVDMIPTDEELEEIRRSFGGAAATAGAGAGTTGGAVTPPSPAPTAAAPAKDVVNDVKRAIDTRIASLETATRSPYSTPGQDSRNQAEVAALKQAVDRLNTTMQERDGKENAWRGAINANKPPVEIAKLGKELEDLNKNLTRMTSDLEARGRGTV